MKKALSSPSLADWEEEEEELNSLSLLRKRKTASRKPKHPGFEQQLHAKEKALEKRVVRSMLVAMKENSNVLKLREMKDRIFNNTWSEMSFSIRVGKATLELFDATANASASLSKKVVPSIQLCASSCVLSQFTKQDYSHSNFAL